MMGGVYVGLEDKKIQDYKKKIFFLYCLYIDNTKKNTMGVHKRLLDMAPVEMKTEGSNEKSSIFSGPASKSFHHPLNTIILNTAPVQRTVMTAPRDAHKRSLKLPKKFSWKGKKGIGKPADQKQCGSCWAVATAGLFSDIVAIHYDMEESPNLSSTYLLSCESQLQCSGGIPSEALLAIRQYGIVGSDCIDYSWCERNKVCNGSALRHFSAEQSYYNSKIPPCGRCKQPIHDFLHHDVEYHGEDSLPICTRDELREMRNRVSCYNKGGKVAKYFGKNVHSVFAENESQLVHAGYDVREHLMRMGPVMGAYFVLTNFIHAKNFDATHGIYLENYPYLNNHGDRVEKGPSTMPFLNNETGYAESGGHAVAIMGWGRDYVDAINPETQKPYGIIRYWVVRNSWGGTWNGDGYFKMAMYPHNKVSQFDMGIKDPSGSWTGGMHLIDFGRKEMVPVDSVVQFNLDEKDEQDIALPTTSLTGTGEGTGDGTGEGTGDGTGEGTGDGTGEGTGDGTGEGTVKDNRSVREEGKEGCKREKNTPNIYVYVLLTALAMVVIFLSFMLYKK